MKKIGKNQIFIIITIAILVVGMVLAGVLGFNKTADEGKSYEVKVTVESAMEEHRTLVKDTCDEYFSENGISCSLQKINDGETLIYKSYTDFTDETADLKVAVESVLAGTGLTVDVNAYEVSPYSNYVIGWVMLGLGLAVVCSFIYLFFIQKLSGALTVLGVSLLSGLLYVALLGITRIPCDPTFIAFGALAVILGGILSTGIVGRCVELNKNVGNDKSSNEEIIAKALKKSYVRIGVVSIALTIVSIALMAFGGFYTFAGVQVLSAIISGTFTAIAWTPMIWPILKKYKRNKRVQSKKTEAN